MATRWLKREEARRVLGDMPERTFARWCAKGMPIKGGKYPWPEIHRWLLEQVERRGRESVRPANLEEARERKLAAEAELAELDLAMKRRELMTVAQYDTAISTAFARVAAQLKTAPTKYAPDVLGLKTLPDAVTRLDTIFHDAMDELYRGDDLPDEDTDGDR